MNQPLTRHEPCARPDVSVFRSGTASRLARTLATVGLLSLMLAGAAEAGFRMQTGTYVGDGNGSRQILGVGFQPDVVIVKGENGNRAYLRTSTMAGRRSKALGASEAHATDKIRGLEPDGFEVHDHVETNESGVNYWWVAFQAAPGALAVGQYTGDGNDDRILGGLGFQPSFVIVAGEEAVDAQHRYPDQARDRSTPFSPSWEESDRIVDFHPDGFEIGTHADVNRSGDAYHYVAIFGDPGQVSALGYTGDGVDGRLLPTPFEPQYAMLTRSDFWGPTMQRPQSLSGDATLKFYAGGLFPDVIEELRPDGLWVGNDTDVNDSSQPYYMVAFRDAVPVDVSIEKWANVASASEGDTITYSVRAANVGSDPASAVVVSDQLPAEVSLLSHGATTGSFDNGTGLWSLGALASGASDTLTLITQVNPGTTGLTALNTASLSSLGEPDAVSTNNADSVAITIDGVDLAVGKSVDDPAPNENDTVTFTISLGNGGPISATGVAIADLLPAGVTYQSSVPSQGSYDEIGGSWNVGTLGSGGLASLDITVTVDTGTGGSTITNVASVAAVDQTDTDNANDSDSAAISVNASDLSLTMVVDDPMPNEGDDVTYTLSILNSGPNAASGVAVTDVLPTGLSYRSDTPSRGSYNSGSGVWTVGSLGNGATATLDLVAEVDTGTGGSTISNNAAITAADQVDPDLGNNGDAVDITVQSADLAVLIAVDDPTPSEGENVVVDITVSNAGPDDASGVRLSLPLPAGLTFVSEAASQGSYDDGTGFWTVGNLASDLNATLQVTASVDLGTSGSTLTPVATVTDSDQADLNASNDSASVDILVGSADLSLAFATANPAPDAGDSVTITITVDNGGPSSADGVEIDATLPIGLTFRSESASRGTYDSGTGIWTVGSLGNGGTASLDLTSDVDAAPTGTTIAGSASVVDVFQEDPDTTNNSVSYELVVGGIDVALTNVVDDTMPDEGAAVTFTITATNNSVADVADVSILEQLASGLTFTGSAVSDGSYDSGSGFWSLPLLGQGSSATLTIDATVDPGTTGNLLTSIASIISASQPDPDPANNTAAAVVAVSSGTGSADLTISKAVSASVVNEGDGVSYEIVVDNLGPSATSGVSVRDVLPGGVDFVSSNATIGSYDDTTGLWTVGALSAGGTDTLTIQCTTAAGTAASSVSNTASIASSSVADPVLDNNAESIAFRVRGADLVVTTIVNDDSPEVGDILEFGVVVVNAGPDDVTGVTVASVLPVGLTLTGSQPSQGSHDSGSGLWTVGSIAEGTSASLNFMATVDTGTEGTTLIHTANVTASDLIDPDTSNDSGSAAVTVEIANQGSFTISAAPQNPAPVRPGTKVEVFRWVVSNGTSSADTLDSVTLQNTTTGAGAGAQLDANWSTLDLEYDGNVVATATVSAGQVTFTPAAVVFPASSTRELVVVGGPSLTARDGDALDLRMQNAADIVFRGAPTKIVQAPLDPAGDFPVDGLVAQQILLGNLPGGSLSLGSQRVVVLDVTLPANGYAADQLQRLNVANDGSALPGADIERMEAWVDDGDGLFDAASDTNLGPFLYTGDRWELTNLTTPVPPAGVRVFATVDIAAGATAGSTIQLQLPGLPDVGVGMLSENDGPVDGPMSTAALYQVTAADRIILSAVPRTPSSVNPGNDVALLALSVTNTYTVGHSLTSLTLANATSGASIDMGDLDGQLEVVTLRDDTDGDGVAGDPVAEPVLGSDSFSNGTLSFNGLDWIIAPGATRNLIVMARVSHRATDGDILRVELSGPSAVTFASPVVSAAAWPLTGNSSIDGLLAAQITNHGAPPRTLGPGEQAVALDVTLPGNGYASDVLQGLAVTNQGTASFSDLSEVRLYQDTNGSEILEVGLDSDLGPLTAVGNQWQTLLLSESLDPGGTRFFVSVQASAGLTDATTVQFAIPVGGVVVASGNDGPLDQSVTNPQGLLLSSAPLQAQLEIDPPISTAGQNVTVRMVLRNVGTEDVQNVTPDLLSATGDGSLSLATGPTPATLDLAVGESDSVEWSYSATTPGSVSLQAGASGTGATSSETRAALPASSSPHTIAAPSTGVVMYPVAAAPFSVNLGQTGVVPLALTFANAGPANAATTAVSRIRVRLEDAVGAGVVPADLLTRVEVREGTNIYSVQATPAPSGDEIHLALNPPVSVTPSEPATVSIALDVASATSVASFRLTLVDAGSLTATDANSGSPVALSLGQGSFPVRSGLATVLAGATELTVSAASAPATLRVGQGQSDVPLLDLSLQNPGVDGITSDVLVETMAITVVDELGSVVADPAAWIDRFAVVSEGTLVADAVVTSPSNPVLIELSTPVIVPVNTPTSVSVAATLTSAAPLGGLGFRLMTGSVAAEDATAREPVSVQITAAPIVGNALTVEAPAIEARVASQALLPEAVAVGTANVDVLALTLRHPGAAGTGRIRCDALTLRCLDRERSQAQLSTFVDRVVVVQGGNEVLSLQVPTGPASEIQLPVPPIVLEPGTTADLTVRIDTEPTSPSASIELVIQEGGLSCSDANTNAPVMTMAENGADYPLSSGLSLLTPPARRLEARLESLMPTNLPASGSDVAAGRLHLINPADEDAGPIVLDHLVLQAESAAGAAEPLGGVVRRLWIYEDDLLLTVSDSLAVDSTQVYLPLTPPLTVAASSSRQLEFRLDLQAAPSSERFRVGLTADGIGVVQPASALLAVEVSPASGSSFPMWTEVGAFAPADLATSFSNYPNPFAAGRQPTRIAYFLDGNAKVTLRVYTPDGQRVITLSDAVNRLSGVHEDIWDGRNGEGNVVRNGVYLAQLVVDYDDGRQEKILRKILVVR